MNTVTCNTVNDLYDAIVAALSTVSGVTFAQVKYRSDISLAAKYREHSAFKEVCANIQLFNNVNALNVYTRAVKRSANNLNNDAEDVKEFVAQSNYYNHDADCYSIALHKKTNKPYLYAIYNSVSSSNYFLDGNSATRADIAKYCTPKAAEKLLNPSKTTHNVTHNIDHDVVIRTIMLQNVQELSVNKTKIVCTF